MEIKLIWSPTAAADLEEIYRAAIVHGPRDLPAALEDRPV